MTLFEQSPTCCICGSAIARPVRSKFTTGWQV